MREENVTAEAVASWTEEQRILCRRADTPKNIISQQFEMLMDGESTVDEFVNVVTRFNNEWNIAGGKKPERLSVEVYQQDWCPGFAAFLDDGSVSQGKAHVCLNVGALMAAVEAQDVAKEDVPYLVAESLMHEFIHALEAWAGVEFSEDKVEALLEKYRVQYGKGVAVAEDPKLTLENMCNCPCGGEPAYFASQGCEGDIPNNIQLFTVYTLKCELCGRMVEDRDIQKSFQKWMDSCLVGQVIEDPEADELEGQA
jgi:hypothetical protein